MAAAGLDVTGIDSDGPSIQQARRLSENHESISFVEGDLFTFPFEAKSFDVVTSVAMLHHVDEVEGLRRLKTLVRSGGTIVIVSFAKPATATDQALMVAGVSLKRLRQLRGRYWEHPSPVCWPPSKTTQEIREIAASELPGSTFTPLMSNRYLLVWTATT